MSIYTTLRIWVTTLLILTAYLLLSRFIAGKFSQPLKIPCQNESWNRRVCTAQWSTSWPIHLQTHSIVGVCMPATYPKKLSCASKSHHWVPLQHQLYPNWEAIPIISNGLPIFSHFLISLFLIFLYSHFKAGWVGQPSRFLARTSKDIDDNCAAEKYTSGHFVVGVRMPATFPQETELYISNLIPTPRIWIVHQQYQIMHWVPNLQHALYPSLETTPTAICWREWARESCSTMASCVDYCLGSK